MILVALGFSAYAGMRHLGWKYFGLGMLAWVVTVAVKFAIAIPVNPSVYQALTRLLPEMSGIGLFSLYVGLLTGMTEVLLVWLVMRYTRLGRATFNQALSFGIGFGVVEALVLAIGSLATILTAILSPQSIPSQVLAQLAQANNPLLGLAPIVERFSTIFVHILSNVLIFYGVVRSEWRWFWLAFVGKSLLDTWASFGQLSGMTGTLEQIWVLEAVVIVWGVVSWAGTRWVGRRYPMQASSPASRAVRWGENSDFFSWGALGALVLVGLVLSLAGSVMQNNTLTANQQENVLSYTEDRTTNLLNALDQNDYGSFSRDLNDSMKATITQDKLAGLRKQIYSKIGNYVSRRVDRIEQTGDHVTLIYAAKYENDDPVTVRVSFTVAEPHLITGLWFDSQKLRQ
jgi:uncharacterized membrane protein YhfC